MRLSVRILLTLALAIIWVIACPVLGLLIAAVVSGWSEGTMSAGSLFGLIVGLMTSIPFVVIRVCHLLWRDLPKPSNRTARY